jgi:hypothetical protein
VPETVSIKTLHWPMAQGSKKESSADAKQITQIHADDFVLLTGQWPHTRLPQINGAP